MTSAVASSCGQSDVLADHQHAGYCQMMLVPVVPVVWAQPVPCAGGYAQYPQEGSAFVGLVQVVEAPGAGEGGARLVLDSCSCSAPALQQGSSGAGVSASTARRQRRQRASERVSFRAQAAARTAARTEKSAATDALSEASTSDGEHSAQGAEGAEAQEAQGILDVLEAGDTRAVEAVRGSVWRLSRDPVGCRAVQAALAAASGDQARAICAELRGKVEDAVYSPHANYVLQKVIEVVPPTASSFIAEELASGGHASSIANHRFGCRVFCRLVEYCSAHESTLAIMDHVLANCEELCRHTFGHYVAKSVLESGTAEQKRRVCQALWSPAAGQALSHSALAQSAQQRNASHVTERAISMAARDDAQAICWSLLPHVVDMSQTPFGRHVVRAMLRDPDAGQAVYAQINANMDYLNQTKYGKRFITEIFFPPALQ